MAQSYSHPPPHWCKHTEKVHIVSSKGKKLGQRVQKQPAAQWISLDLHQ